MLAFFVALTESAQGGFVLTYYAYHMLSIFEAGIYIAFNQVPVYLQWVQRLSPFTHCTKAALIALTRHMKFQCALSPSGLCQGILREVYPCAGPSGAGENHCEVAGYDVLYVMEGVDPRESEWTSLSYLVLIALALRLLQLILMWWPLERIKVYFLGCFSQKHNRVFVGVPKHPLREKSSSQKVQDWGLPGLGEEESKSEMAAVTAGKSCVFVWRSVGAVRRSDGRVLLDNITGVAKSGRLLAIMGPSGSGKTTLIKALSNRASYAKVTGDLMFSGRRPRAEDMV